MPFFSSRFFCFHTQTTICAKYAITTYQQGRLKDAASISIIIKVLILVLQPITHLSVLLMFS